MFKSGDHVEFIDRFYLRFIYNTNPFSNSKNYPPSIYGVIDGDEIARNQFPNEIRYFVIITYINDTFPCAGCGKELNIDSDITCPHCDVDHVFCPGCNKPYNMGDNENDHCPLCGYSSWGMADHIYEELNIVILKALEAKSDEFEFANTKWSFSNPPDDVKEELKYAFNAQPPVNKDDMQDMADAYVSAYSSYLDEYMWEKGLL